MVIYLTNFLVCVCIYIYIKSLINTAFYKYFIELTKRNIFEKIFYWLNLK